MCNRDGETVKYVDKNLQQSRVAVSVFLQFIYRFNESLVFLVKKVYIKCIQNVLKQLT